MNDFVALWAKGYKIAHVFMSETIIPDMVNVEQDILRTAHLACLFVD